jgi:outer membrane protease
MLAGLFFALPGLYGGTGKGAYAFSVSPEVGMFWGKAEEILYKAPGSGDYQSRLLWDLKPLVYAGMGVEFGPRDPWTSGGFTAGLSLKHALPFRTGKMEDRDWGTGGGLTNYSKHDAYSNGSFMAGISGGFSWVFVQRITLRVYGEFSYLRFSLTAEDGYSRYPPEEPAAPVFGTGISYTQNWFAFSPGVRFALRISRYFSVSLFVTATPFVYGFCRDDHHIKEMRYEDYLDWGLFIQEGAGFAFSPRENLEFTLSLGGRHIGRARGDNYYRGTGTVPDTYSLAADRAGGGLRALEAGLSVKITR